ncbi:MAG: rhodanese-like domain-containing protein [Gammaproteobacteria bacterium]|nr:rhodanese-like domain-containing protein [Gammaproteobacteria bacterium]MCP4879973.1 rhodanese-like domain-containing protein [Gammaproteobacteria bacterium]
MDRIIEFSINHWDMVLALLATLAMLIWTERRKAAPSVTPQQATVMGNSDDALMLDIRSAADYKSGRVLNSTNIPFAELSKRLDDLKKYRDKPVVLICKTGQTAGSAANMLRKDGYSKVYRMTGGMVEWTNQGLPLVRK